MLRTINLSSSPTPLNPLPKEGKFPLLEERAGRGGKYEYPPMRNMNY